MITQTIRIDGQDVEVPLEIFLGLREFPNGKLHPVNAGGTRSTKASFYHTAKGATSPGYGRGNRVLKGTVIWTEVEA